MLTLLAAAVTGAMLLAAVSIAPNRVDARVRCTAKGFSSACECSPFARVFSAATSSFTAGRAATARPFGRFARSTYIARACETQCLQPVPSASRQRGHMLDRELTILSVERMSSSTCARLFSAVTPYAPARYPRLLRGAQVPGGAEAKRASQQRVRRLLTGRSLAAPSARDGAPGEAQLHDEEGAVAAEKVGAAPYRLKDGSHGRTPSPEEVSSDGTRSVFEASANDVRAHDAVWGVGPVRTLRDYETFAGVDFSTCTVSAQSNQGGLPSEQCFWDRFAELSAFLEGTRVDGGRN
eukprot:5283943-Pleurochrysis_carterae.AAC.5